MPKENKNSQYIDGSNWITIRFDGKNFGKFIKTLRKNNILSPGYSEDFALIMKECCQKLMNEFNAIYPSLSKKYDVFFYPFFLKDVALEPSFNQKDMIHPNKNGVIKIIENIFPYFLRFYKSLIN